MKHGWNTDKIFDPCFVGGFRALTPPAREPKGERAGGIPFSPTLLRKSYPPSHRTYRRIAMRYALSLTALLLSATCSLAAEPPTPIAVVVPTRKEPVSYAGEVAD